MVMSGHSTVISESSDPEPPLYCRRAVFGTRPQSAASVVATIWTDVEAAPASGAGPKLSTPAVMLQPVLAGLIAQLMPPGRVSVTVTPKAVPTPVLVTVTVKPIWSPALTTASSAVLVITISGQLTTIVASSSLFSRSPSDLLEAVADARFG